MTTNADLDLLTIAEAAKLLKVSTITVHRWLKGGRLPAHHLGPKTVRIRRIDLRAWCGRPGSARSRLLASRGSVLAGSPLRT